MTESLPDTIDLERVRSLRPVSALARIHPDEELLPLSPVLLLPHLGVTLLEVAAGLGPWLQPCLRAASAADAAMAVAVEGEPGRGARGGIHGAISDLWDAVRGARFRGPLVVHGRLGTVEAGNVDAEDAARVRVLEAVDAGVTSAQLGAHGEPQQVAAFLVSALEPLAESGLGVVVQAMDAQQAAGLPPLLDGRLPVDAWLGLPAGSDLPRKDAHDAQPPPVWGELTAALGPVIRNALTGHAALGSVVALHALFTDETDPVRERLETRLYGEVEDALGALRARRSAGRVMAALSIPEPDMPFE